MISDNDLLDFVSWPKEGLTIEHVREIFRTVKRFLDFDGTLVDSMSSRVLDHICGRSIFSFLCEEPFVIQTWNPEGAIGFFQTWTTLPPPRLIIEPPGKVFSRHKVLVNEEVEEWAVLAKDFEALGITGVQIIDDAPHLIHAPECEVILP